MSKIQPRPSIAAPSGHAALFRPAVRPSASVLNGLRAAPQAFRGDPEEGGFLVTHSIPGIPTRFPEYPLLNASMPR